MAEKRTGVITKKGKPLTLLGPEIRVGDKAPDFTVLNNDFEPVKLSDFKGKVKIISVVPSIDTSVCAFQTRRFNIEANKFPQVEILTISVDLPYALERYCDGEGIDKVTTLSDHRDLSFGLKYGFLIDETRLLARGIIIIDKDDIVRYIQYVPEITNHPDYDKALEVLKTLV